MDVPSMQDVFILSPVSGLYSTREELGLMSCDDISRYNVGGSQPGSKSSEAVSYYLDQDSGQYFSLLESDGPPGPEYDRTGRNTGVRRRDKTPTHDSDNSLLRYLSDDKILVIEEEPEGPGRESRRESTRRSRRKSRNPSSPSFPISPSLLSSTLWLDAPPEALPVLGVRQLRGSVYEEGSLTSASRRRISCKDLGHGDCEGWLWKKKDAKGYFTQKWRKYWFILKESCLYCAFKACHPKIKSFFFATDCLEEMNRWMNRLGLAAIGYTPDDKVPRPDEDYWSESDQDEVDGSMTLKQEGPSVLCDTYHRTPSTHLFHNCDQLPRSVSSMSLLRSTPSPLPHSMSASTSPVPPQMLASASPVPPQMVSSTSPLPPQVNSSSPFPEPKHQGRHFSSESTHSHSSAEEQQQQQQQQRGDPMGMGTGTGSTSTHSSGCRSTHRERRSWQDLIETPLTSSGLHFLQTGPGDLPGGDGGYGGGAGGMMGGMAGEMGMYGGLGRHSMSPERRRQATLPVRRHYAAERDRERDGPFPLERGPHTHAHTHGRSHKQRSQSLPRNRDPRPGKPLHTPARMEERSEDEEAEAEGHPADLHAEEEDRWEMRGEGRERRVSEGRERRVSEGREPEGGGGGGGGGGGPASVPMDGLEQLYRALEQANVTALGDPRPCSRQELRRCFTQRTRDPLLNDRLHRVRALRSTLKVQDAAPAPPQHSH
ncbi:hypothetical protein CRUP_030485 [Coryphaenoides rupestris]|nr:hypothetical protein CRUP_030485 [Coryphaenoides rupestris]